MKNSTAWLNYSDLENPMGESKKDALRVNLEALIKQPRKMGR